nr:nucleoside hydrolase [Celeribacter ethanolicus]
MCTIAWAIDPTLFSLTEMAVLIDTNEGPNFGRTVYDSRKRAPSQPIVNVARDVDADRVFALLAERIARY